MIVVESILKGLVVVISFLLLGLVWLMAALLMVAWSAVSAMYSFVMKHNPLDGFPR